MDKTIGLYIHIPFCKKKCAYCDFFSGASDISEREQYVRELQSKIKLWGETANEKISSVYFGGGTPSVLGTEPLCELLNSIKREFCLSENTEITLEVNPESGRSLDFDKLKQTGFNRLSIGLQSSNPTELKALGRIHTAGDAALTVERARHAGFDNLSLDLMLAIPYQTKASLKESIEFCAKLGVTHISSYLLKIEEGTRFYSLKESFPFPDEDEQAELYLYAVGLLEQLGYRQYEVSNFAKPSFESRHNTLYWKCGEYIGIGPSAHSFYHGRRFYYPRDTKQFYLGKTVDDGAGGGEDEFIMLALRLKPGLIFSEYRQKFGKPLSPDAMQKIKLFAKAGLAELTDESASLTPKGFLVSNAIIAEIVAARAGQ